MNGDTCKDLYDATLLEPLDSFSAEQVENRINKFLEEQAEMKSAASPLSNTADKNENEHEDHTDTDTKVNLHQAV